MFEIDKLEAIFFFLIINLVIILVNMSQRYSIAQKCDMLEEYILNNKNTKQTNQRLASRWNIHRALKISHNLFANIYRNFREFGSVHSPPRKQATVRTPENIERVRQVVQAHADADEDIGSRRIALEVEHHTRLLGGS